MNNTKKAIAALLLLVAPALLVSKGWAGEYTDKSYHSDEIHTYKHPVQGSFTGPFDYGGKTAPRPARVEVSDKCNCFTFDATKSYDVDGQRLSINWDFGDGQTSDQSVVQHCYEKPGTYNVSLTVKDTSGMTCDTGVTSSKVEANPPAQANAGAAQEACVGQAVKFDSSASSAGTQTWDFGDGETGTGTSPSHAYQKAGDYRVLLTVDDGKKTKCSVAQASTTARIHQNAFVTLAGVESTCVGRTVSFDAQGSGGKYHWDFGDGETWDGGSRASHTFTKTGTHTVTVTVDDGSGSSCSSASDKKTITVNEPPTAKIGNVASCLMSEPVNFDGSASSGGTLTYLWNFGDGETAEGAKVSHQYKKAGSYRVTLTVRNGSEGNCNAASDSVVTTVNNRPEAVISIS